MLALYLLILWSSKVAFPVTACQAAIYLERLGMYGKSAARLAVDNCSVVIVCDYTGRRAVHCAVSPVGFALVFRLRYVRK